MKPKQYYEREDVRQGITFVLLCAHPHGDSEEIESLHLHLGSDLMHYRPLPQDIRASTTASLNPYFSYDYELSKQPKILPFIWPCYTPTTTLDVKINDFCGLFSNRCTLVECEHEKKQFCYFDPSPSEKYKDALGKTKNIRLATVAVDDLFIPSEKEPLSEWFSAERYALLQKNRIVLPTEDEDIFCMHYEAIIQDAVVKDDRKEYMLLHVRNPLAPNKDLELLAWRFTRDNLPYGQQPPREIGAEFYFIGNVMKNAKEK